MTGYVICATPRSGSTLLCSLLTSSGVAGSPQSLFRVESMADYASDRGIARADGGYDWDDYLRAALIEGRGATGVFGLRLMFPTLGEVLARVGPGGLEGALGPLAYVHLYRRDLVAQAVSLHRAVASGIWHLGIEEAALPGVPRYDFAVIEGYVQQARAANAGWERWFAAEGIVPMRVAYEDLAADAVGVAGRVLDYLGLVPLRSLQAVNQRMAGVESADWAARYRAEAEISAG